MALLYFIRYNGAMRKNAACEVVILAEGIMGDAMHIGTISWKLCI